MSGDLDKFSAAVDAHADAFIDRLRKAVAIPSISAELPRRGDVFRMAEYLKCELESLGVVVESRANPLGKQHGTDIDLPPILLGTYGTDAAKPTVLVYGHYDVQPASKGDGWGSEPFELTLDEKTGRMYGRGASDDKGPVLGWLNAIQAFKSAGVDFPVNLKVCFEGMEEYGSEGLDELIVAEASKYFADVDCVCISDNYWLGSSKPCLTYGLRGVSYFNLIVKGPGADLHSGVFGGTVHEPMTDLIQLFATLVDPKGKILIPGIYDKVAPMTDEERKIYDGIDFSIEEFQDALGNKTNLKETVQETLMARWRYPSLSLHGIEGAFYGAGAKTVIPAKVNGKFSIRTVPDMQTGEVSALVQKHIETEFAKLGSKNTVSVEELHAGKPWYSSPDHWNFRAAAKATEYVYKVKPDLTREGGSIPVTLTFEESLGKNVCLLPMGQGNDGAHSINEKLDRGNYINGTKLLGAYLYEIARVDRS
ncbi:hypothetical protein PYCC9005_004528 [Savitreella phatthalungensis]